MARTKIIKALVDDAEYRRIEHAARRSKKSISTWLREAAEAYMKVATFGR